jgi:hypothetical protein
MGQEYTAMGMYASAVRSKYTAPTRAISASPGVWALSANTSSLMGEFDSWFVLCAEANYPHGS